MKQEVTRLGLAGAVTLTGYVNDRNTVLNAMREADVFLFCHKTPESPRCLVEALASGCPIVGYKSGYPQEITEQHGGGLFVPTGNHEALARLLVSLSSDRDTLSALIKAAALSGRQFERDAAMERRINLIRENIAPRERLPWKYHAVYGRYGR
jgi:glycosyltransferase involved in cell wall biosynthesis